MIRNIVDNNKTVRVALIGIICLAFLFQIGHFIEHVLEVYFWTFVDHNRIYMSPVAMYFEMMIAHAVVPSANMERMTAVGKEILHLIGDIIFFSGIISLWLLAPLRQMKAALYLQTYHTYEHLSLAGSVLWASGPIGFSTLFGAPLPIWFRFGYRVYWHFFMNLIPMILIGISLYILYKGYRASQERALQHG